MTVPLIIDSRFNRRGVQEAENAVRTMVGNISGMFEQANANIPTGMQADIAEGMFGNFAGGDIQAAITSLRTYAQEMRAAAAAQIKLGEGQKGLNLLAVADQADHAANRFETLTDKQEESGSALDFINNKFNKFAFGLFVVTGAINTITRAIRQMNEFLIEAASSADRLSTFSTLMEQSGHSANDLAAALRHAGQGAVTLDTAIKPTLQLLKAGLPEAAAQTDALLKIATNAAILSGEIDNVDQIYQKLVRGIVRGSPRLIDDADIILKLGDAYETYAATLGKTADQLTATEQKMATLVAVMEEGERINELAEEVDSAALTFQKLKTDIIEVGTEFKQFFARTMADAIESAKTLLQILAALGGELMGLSDEAQRARLSLAEAFAERPFTSFLETVKVGAFAIKEVIAFIINALRDLNMAFIETGKVGGKVIQILVDWARGAKTAEQAGQELRQLVIDTSNTLADGLDPTEHYEQAWENIENRVEEARVTLGLVDPELQDVASSAESAAARMSNAFNEMSAGIQAAIEARTGLDAQFAEKRADIEEDLAEKIIDINEGLSDRIADINESLRSRLVEIGEKYQEDVAKVAEDTQDRLADIDEELAEKLEAAAETAGDARKDAMEQKNKGIEDAQEKHQKKLLDIERKFEASRLKALIDRDARALFEAEQARKEGREEAEDDLSDALKEEEEQLQERLEKIAEIEEKRREQAMEAAEERRKDALEAQAERLKDLEESFKKEKAKAAKAAAEQRREAIMDAQERRQDALEAQRDALMDLDDWYREQLLRQKEANLQRKISELEHLDEMGELTQQHLDELRGMWDDYNSFVAGETGATPTGGTTPPTVGGGSGGGAGGNGGTIGGAQPGGGNSGGFTPLFPGGSGHTLGQMTLNINSNDKTLEEVLRSSTYDAVLETMQE